MIEWHPIVEGVIKPELIEDFYAWKRSKTVLITDGVTIFTGHMDRWNECDEKWSGREDWKMTGPDGYKISNPTHWAEILPSLFPEK